MIEMIESRISLAHELTNVEPFSDIAQQMKTLLYPLMNGHARPGAEVYQNDLKTRVFVPGQYWIELTKATGFGGESILELGIHRYFNEGVQVADGQTEDVPLVDTFFQASDCHGHQTFSRQDRAVNVWPYGPYKPIGSKKAFFTSVQSEVAQLFQQTD